MTERCNNPACPDDGPELFSWLGSEYCSWNCQWTHKRALAEAAVDRIDEVIGDASETPSSSTLPAEQDPSGVRVPIGPSDPSVAAAALWGPSGVEFPTGPAPVSTSDYGETHTVGPLLEPDRPGLVERAIKRVFG